MRAAHEARPSCRVLSHDAADLDCGGARRAASPWTGRAGADRSDSTRCDDLLDAAGQSGQPASGRPGALVIARGDVDPAIEFVERRGHDSRPRESVHAGDAACRRDRFAARRFPVNPRRFPINGCLPVNAPASCRPGLGAAEAEEGRAARDRAQRRSSPDASARHVLRHRESVRALFGDRRRRRLADRPRRGRPWREGAGGRTTCASAWRSKATWSPGKRAGLLGTRGSPRR